jgi:hypothetical protein
VLEEVVVSIEQAGAAIMDAMVSPLRGADGNAEFLVHVRRSEQAPGSPRPGRVLDVDALVREAAGPVGDGEGTA